MVHVKVSRKAIKHSTDWRKMLYSEKLLCKQIFFTMENGQNGTRKFYLLEICTNNDIRSEKMTLNAEDLEKGFTVFWQTNVTRL